jgi:hypothetical protein
MIRRIENFDQPIGKLRPFFPRQRGDFLGDLFHGESHEEKISESASA